MNTLTPASTNHHIKALDGLRGLAVLMVIFHHISLSLGHHLWVFKASLFIANLGFLGIDVFFALSGFLITGILLKSKHQSKINFFGGFYYRRALRIFPLYYGVLALLICIPPLVGLDTGGQQRFVDDQWWFWLYGANIYREVPALSGGDLDYGWFELTHFWTLAVEEHFYLFWPLLVYFLNERKLIWTNIILILISLLIHAGFIHSENPLILALLVTPKYLSGLLLGSLCAIILPYIQKSSKLLNITSNMIPLLGMVFLSQLGILLYTGHYVKQEYLHATLPHLLIAILTSLILIHLVVGKNTNAYKRFFEHTTLRFFGKYSYGLYVYHYLFAPTLRSLPIEHFPGGYTIGMIAYSLIYLLLPLLLSMMSYHYFEKPILDLKTKIFNEK